MSWNQSGNWEHKDMTQLVAWVEKPKEFKKKRFVNFVQSEVPSKSHNTRDTSRTKRRQTRVYLILANVGPTILQYKYAHTRKWLETNIKLTLWESSKCTRVRREWFTWRCANFRRRGQSRTPTILMKWKISHGKTSSQTQLQLTIFPTSFQ
jgi:hypothetical protein